VIESPQLYTKQRWSLKLEVKNKQFLWQDFPWHFPDFWSIPDSSLIAVKFSDISMFTRHVVTPTLGSWFHWLINFQRLLQNIWGVHGCCSCTSQRYFLTTFSSVNNWSTLQYRRKNNSQLRFTLPRLGTGKVLSKQTISFCLAWISWINVNSPHWQQTS